MTQKLDMKEYFYINFLGNQALIKKLALVKIVKIYLIGPKSGMCLAMTKQTVPNYRSLNCPQEILI